MAIATLTDRQTDRHTLRHTDGHTTTAYKLTFHGSSFPHSHCVSGTHSILGRVERRCYQEMGTVEFKLYRTSIVSRDKNNYPYLVQQVIQSVSCQLPYAL